MASRILKIIWLGLAIPLAAQAQINTFTDQFEDGSLDTTWNGETHILWEADHPRTFGLSESNGVLTIEYTRDADSDAWDNFNFTPPEHIDVSGSPQITLDIKSDVATTYTLKPIYSNGNDRLIDKQVPGDNEWHTYQFNLESSTYSGGLLTKMYMYFDGGSNDASSGTVQFDNLEIGGFNIRISNLQATVVDSTNIDLTWSVEDDSEVDHYNIYRSTESGFVPGEETLIGDTTETTFHDTGLQNFTSYYYVVTAVGPEGEEFSPSSEASARTHTPGTVPQISIESTNATEVKKYEKFEVILSLDKATYQNPYDPEEIKVYAWFKSPAGDTTWINGFYDNYNSRDDWKLRFSPNKPGEWEYRVFAENPYGQSESNKDNFNVINSDYKGWLRISHSNSNYLMHDDSTSFYGLAVYYPWGIEESKLDEFVSYGGNIIGYWNSTYDGGGNGGGRYLIESKASGIGRYDQRKAARIDQILQWSEERDLKVMLAIWAHDWLRLEGQPWGHAQWNEKNPYSEIVDVEDFYTDSLAWEYQKKQYRYVIARWGYSRALGVWELINEIHGTSGYVRNKSAAKQWLTKINAYFQENDPYQRPTTASFDAISEWSSDGKYADIPNDHYYEQYDNQRYSDDVVRSGLWGFTNRTDALKSKGDRPAYFGEAGYYSMFSDAGSPEYTQEMHNTFWSGLAKGLASVPFWWEFNQNEIFTDNRMMHYTYFKDFVDDIDFAHQKFNNLIFNVPEADIYGLKSDEIGFAWMRNHQKSDVSELDVRTRGMSQRSYGVLWYDTWTGDTVHIDTLASVRDILKTEVPLLEKERRDIVVKFHPIDNGETAAGLRMFFVEPKISSHPEETSYTLLCYVQDEEGRLVTGSEKEIQFSVQGPGSMSSEVVTTAGGVASVDYILSSGESGEVSITAEAEGVDSYTLGDITVTDVEGKSNQSNVPEEYSLRQNYPNPFNPSTQINYQLPEKTRVLLRVYDLTGRLVQSLVNETQSAGQYSVSFNAGDMASGVYIYHLETDSYSEFRQMTLIK